MLLQVCESCWAEKVASEVFPAFSGASAVDNGYLLFSQKPTRNIIEMPKKWILIFCVFFYKWNWSCFCKKKSGCKTNKRLMKKVLSICRNTIEIFASLLLQNHFATSFIHIQNFSFYLLLYGHLNSQELLCKCLLLLMLFLCTQHFNTFFCLFRIPKWLELNIKSSTELFLEAFCKRI